MTCVRTPEPTEGGRKERTSQSSSLYHTHPHTCTHTSCIYTRTNTFKKRRQIFGMFDMEKRISKLHLIPCYKKFAFGLFTYHPSSGQPHPSSLRLESQLTYNFVPPSNDEAHMHFGRPAMWILCANRQHQSKQNMEKAWLDLASISVLCIEACGWFWLMTQEQWVHSSAQCPNWSCPESQQKANRPEGSSLSGCRKDVSQVHRPVSAYHLWQRAICYHTANDLSWPAQQA